jgi:hypothetical protein
MRPNRKNQIFLIELILYQHQNKVLKILYVLLQFSKALYALYFFCKKDFLSILLGLQINLSDNKYLIINNNIFHILYLWFH